jgi:hypothetical protein
VAFDRNELDRQFADIQRMNMSVVRIFVFEDLEGLEFDKDGYVSGVDGLLLDNFTTAAELAKDHGLSLYLCLTNNVFTTCRKLHQRNFVNDLKARDAYLANAVRPFVTRLKGKAVFAIDLINEPEWEPEANYPPSVLRSFVRDGAATVHRADPARKVSVGAVNAEACAKYQGTGINVYEFHTYNTHGYLPPVESLKLNLPVLIGECGAEPKDAENDDALNRAVGNFLRNARNNGYAGALYWCYGGPQNGHALMDVVRGKGSSEWRPVAYTLRDFQWQQPRVTPKRTTTKKKR